MIIILNGSPRSGKSSIAKAMVGWTNLGVDHWREHRTPEEFQPGIGLRPGGERPLRVGSGHLSQNGRTAKTGSEAVG